MTAHPKKFWMTLETSNRMSGARCLLVLYFLMMFLNLQNVRTMNVHRLRTLTEVIICQSLVKTCIILHILITDIRTKGYTLLQADYDMIVWESMSLRNPTYLCSN